MINLPLCGGLTKWLDQLDKKKYEMLIFLFVYQSTFKSFSFILLWIKRPPLLFSKRIWTIDFLQTNSKLNNFWFIYIFLVYSILTRSLFKACSLTFLNIFYETIFTSMINTFRVLWVDGWPRLWLFNSCRNPRLMLYRISHVNFHTKNTLFNWVFHDSCSIDFINIKNF